MLTVNKDCLENNTRKMLESDFSIQSHTVWGKIQHEYHASAFMPHFIKLFNQFDISYTDDGSGGFNLNNSTRENVNNYYTYQQTGGGNGGGGNGGNGGCLTVVSVVLFFLWIVSKFV